MQGVRGVETLIEMSDVLATKAFLRSYERASAPMQHLAEQEVRLLVRRMAETPQTWLRSYDKVEGLRLERGRVIELELGGGPRLLAHVDEAVTLWRMGDHEITTHAGGFDTSELERPVTAPAMFGPSARLPFFPEDRDEGLTPYALEMSPDWVYELDREQWEVAERVRDSVTEALLGDGSAVHLILGGPGTGKTTLLLWLLKQLAAVASDSSDGWDVRLLMTASLRNFVENATGWSLGQVCKIPQFDGPPDVILLDDPAHLASIVGAVADQRGRLGRAVVVAGLDPLQLDESVSDSALTDCAEAIGATQWWLGSCYRQKRVVGEASAHIADVIAQSSPFLADAKKRSFAADHAELTARSNGVRFPNPSGIVRTYQSPTNAEFVDYVGWLNGLRRAHQLWDHWAPVLVVTDPQADVPDDWMRRLDPISTHRISTEEIHLAKGLEYQHALMLLGAELHSSLQSGFEGSGQSAYGRYRLLRIPFTRAKDSVTTFVLQTERN